MGQVVSRAPVSQLGTYGVKVAVGVSTGLPLVSVKSTTKQLVRVLTYCDSQWPIK